MKKEFNLVNVAAIMTAVLFLTLPVTLAFSDELFHVVSAVDSAADVQSYKDKPVSMATDAFGAPSAAWFNPTDETLIDYIFVGQSAVLTFHVLKEGKNIQEVVSESRSTWESGGCMAYPECPHHTA